MKKAILLLAALALIAAAHAVRAEEGQNDAQAAEKREDLDAMAQEALDKLFADNARATELYESAYGYAVFDNLKIALGLSGGGGSGVAVAKNGSERTYMKMGTGGVGLGLGGQKYQVVFLFETENAFRSFVDKGWKAETGAQAAAGTKGASAEATFHDGLAIFKMNDKGLMASADVSGTKYWKNKKLN
ncbi:MAG TPA: YSC84-related protein [Candidatus Polarisedimenticolaceae bacterium]|nr:YSC84-related protein [Candidatus Polarisedimenticolaceae bacterium]